MSYEVTLDTDVNCAFIHHKGQIGLEEIPASLDEVLAHPNFTKGMNILRDSRNARQPDEYGYDFFTSNSSQRLSKFESAFGICKLAWVISDAREFAIVHQYTLARRMSEDLIERQPFRTIQSAKEWLGIPPEYQTSD
jgi:hypothetical protein